VCQTRVTRFARHARSGGSVRRLDTHSTGPLAANTNRGTRATLSAQMGDTPLQPGLPAQYDQQDPTTCAFQASSTAGSGPGRVIVEGHPALPPTYLHQQSGSPQHAFSSQLDMTQQPHGLSRGQPFDMNAMMGALPQPQGTYRPGPYGQGHTRYNAIAMSSPVSPYGTQATAPVPAQQYYLAQQHGHLGHFYPTPMAPQPAPASISSRADMGYYQNAVMVGQQPHAAAQYYYPQAAHFPGQGPTQPLLAQYAVSSPQQQMDSRQVFPPPHAIGQVGSSASPAEPGQGNQASWPESEGRHSIVRGPPRKPRQSGKPPFPLSPCPRRLAGEHGANESVSAGHAIWIGNLPPQADLMSLVHHVCKEAEELESLFLISKSNCAFANFKDEQASIAAQRKLHDSKFHSVRLVSRLRKSTVEGPAGLTAPTGPAASTAQGDAPAETATGEEDGEEEGTRNPLPVAASGHGEHGLANAPAVESSHPLRDRFFVLKSLTIEDIELSARTGIWATQSHNEATLNKAFKVRAWRLGSTEIPGLGLVIECAG